MWVPVGVGVFWLFVSLVVVVWLLCVCLVVFPGFSGLSGGWCGVGWFFLVVVGWHGLGVSLSWFRVSLLVVLVGLWYVV